jgi:uncharacterized membrane protein (UPF0127 family)
VSDAEGDAAPHRNRRRLWWLLGGVAAVAVAGLVVFLAGRSGDSDAASPLVTGSPDRVPLAGFGEVSVTVHGSGGDYAGCLLLADTATLRDKGLMGVTDPDLGGYDGMVFLFDADSRVPFWMRDTPMPLSLAYVSRGGDVTSTVDMAPCGDVATCPIYKPGDPYRFAIEVAQGRLGRLGLTAGATVELGPQRCGP